MATPKKTPAEVVIETFGIRPLARELDIDPTTVNRWRKSGLVPAQYHVPLLDLAKRDKMKLTANDLVHGRD